MRVERKAAVFDLDGTLVDTAADLAASMNVALAAAGLAPAPASAVRDYVGHGARRMLREGYCLSTGCEPSDAELDDGLKTFLDHYEENIAVHSAPFPGALEVAARFREAGWGLAVCTNKREFLAKKLLEALGVAEAFDVIVGADTASAPKPDPAPVRLCLSATSSDGGVFFGDSDTDIRAAGAAGLPCWIFTGGYGPLTLAPLRTFAHYDEARAAMRDDFDI